MPKNKRDLRKEYMESYGFREERNIYNLTELYKISGDMDFVMSLKGLFGSRASDDPKEALKWSTLYLWMEARECFVYGEFQACVLTCGAAIEHCLKLEYEKINGKLPDNKYSTLGNMIQECKGIVDKDVLSLAGQIVKPRNSRAHAILEHSDPQLAIMGGPERGIDQINQQAYLIEPYRGEAARAIKLSSRILKKLYQETGK